MANALIKNFSPAELLAGAGGTPAGGAKDPFGLVQTNLGAGLAFPAPLPQPFTAQVSSVYGLFWIPAVAGLGTGMTLELTLVDDLNNPSPGKLATFDVSYAQVVTGTTVENDAAFTGTADSLQVTMPATAGVLKTVAIPAVNAHFAGTPAVNGWCLIRIRRKPAASDTHVGRIVVLGVTVIDT